ncbi:HalOD1 output domain-containing protein [Halosolutus amylolyticus]|uniref:HalOD1 output domain-containing protein n=1 Tax=Halosolutus amylolyticus TaxID=2932267 RepID=A0ABD5PJ89_9EURY|nr:HalOD1 output domain-containing protein [Halosolutus amylolyticus]
MPSRDDASQREDAFVTTFDPGAGERASNTVVTAVASVTGDEPADLSPLYDVVEPDALDALCAHADRTGGDSGHRLWFPYEGFDVCVHSDGEVRILETPSTASA